MTLIRRKGCLVCKPKQPGHEYTEHTFTDDFTVAASRIHGRLGFLEIDDRTREFHLEPRKIRLDAWQEF